MKNITFALAALLITSLVIGCGLISITTIFEYEIEGDIHSTNATLQYESIDLNTISDYRDHKDKIKSVDNIALVGSVINLGNTTVSGEVWLAYTDTYTTPQMVRDNATRIFVSPPIQPGETLEIDWENGLDYIENFSEVQDAVELGQFTIYGLGDSEFFDVSMDLDVIVTITAGL